MALGTGTGAIGLFFCMENALNLFLAFSTPFCDGTSLKPMVLVLGFGVEDVGIPMSDWKIR